MTEHYYAADTKKRRIWPLLKKLAKWTLVLLIIGGVIWLVLHLTDKGDTPPQTSNEVNSVQRPSQKIFRSAYFQFQTSDDWVENAQGTEGNQYFYRAYRGNLIEQDLLIFVNPSARDLTRLQATRVVPVKPTAAGRLNPTETISEHCGTTTDGANRDPREITYKEVTFTCLVDGVIFDALAGQVGGTEVITMKRPDDTTVKFVIYYRDLRANPVGRDFGIITDSFQTR